MKTINNFIIEHLECSTFPINEKLKISSKSKTYNYFPKDKFELREILEERLAEDNNADLNDIDVSEITDMGWHGLPNGESLFEDLDPCNIDISEWDVSNVTDMNSMFFGCENFTGKGLENWNVSKVENMERMFDGCTKFNCDLGKWDVSKVETMSYMFYKCTNFNADLNNWNVSKVTDMSWMFNWCEKFTGKGLENWDVYNVKDMGYMFNGCKSLKNKPSWHKV